MGYEMLYRSCCGGTGYRWVWPFGAHVSMGPTVFRCDCGIGRAKVSTGIPLWDDFRHGKRYTASQPLPAPATLPAPPAPAVVEPEAPAALPTSPFTAEELATLREVKATREVERLAFREIVARHGKSAVVHAMREM